jgi:two-component system, chemotaxis family, chemotaxis protein CheY
MLLMLFVAVLGCNQKAYMLPPRAEKLETYGRADRLSYRFFDKGISRRSETCCERKDLMSMSISVLLVSRNHVNTDTLRRGLVISGCKDIQTVNGRNDLGAFLAAGGKFDVAVVHMDEDYSESLENISTLRKSCSQSECIVISSINEADLARECVRRGAYDYITMPFTRETLLSTLKEAVLFKVPVYGRPQILIMEDDPVSGRLMQKYLAPCGDCTLVVDGRAAIEAFEDAVLGGNIYHLLVLDIMVPEIHGKDVLKKIREIELQHGIPAGRRSRAIMTTALSDTGNVVESFKGHCDAYLVKPIDRKILLAELTNLGFNTEIAAPK